MSSSAEPVVQTVSFDHKFFSTVTEPVFSVSEQSGDAGLAFRLGDDEVVLAFSGIRREFQLDGTADSAMLDLIARGLQYVKELHIGDGLPDEIVTGRASWEVEQRHRDIAFQRLTMQLVTWLTGGETVLTDPAELLQIAEDPATRAKINEAFTSAAAELGFGDDRDRVVSLIEELAAELCHIEALRERFAAVVAIADKVRGLQSLYRSDQTILDILDSNGRLLGVAHQQLGVLFAQVDGRTSEILAILRDVGPQIELVRGARDDLYCRLRAWENIAERWRVVELKRSSEIEDLTRATYQFLARRFMQHDEWKLVGQLFDNTNGSTAMTW